MARARHHTGTVTLPALLGGLMARAKAIVPRHTGPRLARDQRTRLALVNTAHIELMAKGGTDPNVMQQWAEGLLLWHYVADKLNYGEPEMAEQLALATLVLRRFTVSRKVELLPAEMELARRGAMMCDILVEAAPLSLAEDAALWAEAQMLVVNASLKQGCEIKLKVEKP